MKKSECGRGHIYDADIYQTCPYCSDTFPQINFGEIPVGDGGRTAPVSSYGGAQRSVQDAGVTRPPKGYGGQRRVDEENKTVGVMGKKLGVEPVVGWLVCVEGVEKGKDFRILGKINTVGKSEQMDICIKGDKSITSDTHARIGYDPRHNYFHLIPANSSNNTYLNEEPVYVPTKLKAYDMIELGETKLLFVPFCGGQFSWETGVTGCPPEGVSNGID